MIIAKSMHPSWLSNTWLVGDRAGGHGVLVDTGGPFEPIAERIVAEQLTITHILNTHHHYDHVAENERYQELTGASIYAHASEKHLIAGCDKTLAEGDEIVSGDLKVRALHIPGHTCGQLAFLIEGVGCFTGDTLFKGSIGGTRAPGHTTFEDIHSSIMERLMTLPPETRLFPGHEEPTTVAEEWQQNPFIRTFRGLDQPSEEACEALGRMATLKVLARDYDGGTKAWVAFQPDGEQAIVPGSRVRKL